MQILRAVIDSINLSLVLVENFQNSFLDIDVKSLDEKSLIALSNIIIDRLSNRGTSFDSLYWFFNHFGNRKGIVGAWRWGTGSEVAA